MSLTRHSEKAYQDVPRREWRMSALYRTALGVLAGVVGGIVTIAATGFLESSGTPSQALRDVFGSAAGWVAMLAFATIVFWAGSSHYRRIAAESRERILENQLELRGLEFERAALRERHLNA